MKAAAPALLYALFVWWFTTGLVLLAVLRGRTLSLVLAALLCPASLLLLAVTSRRVGIFDAYGAFTAAILLWGALEVGFLTGCLTGPRPRPCPCGATGRARLQAAIGAILYHELSLIGAGIAVFAVTAGGANQIGALTFLVLWIMRLSAKLNLFLGVPVLNDELLPPRVAYLKTYFRRAPVGPFFPASVMLSVFGLAGFGAVAADADATLATEAGYTLIASLMGLAIIEHVFMVVALPVDRLWAWSASLGGPARRPESGADVASVEPDRKIERVAATQL